MTQLSLVMNHERRIAHLLASQRKLHHLVDVDTLTRLPNRRHFHELAERAVEAARDAATLIVFDVDRMQRVNELLGHPTGDEALRQIGTALRETLRRRDVAGRLGGDDFAASCRAPAWSTRRSSSRASSPASTTVRSRRASPGHPQRRLGADGRHETIGEALRRAERARRSATRRAAATPAAAARGGADRVEEEPRRRPRR